MHFAIYGRKSVYSDKSDSIKNQVRMCRDYIGVMFPGEVESITEYTDEGLTGANTNRPGLKRMLKDAKDGLINVLVVYQLDRLTRDVRDFANIYAMLEDKRVKFVSVKENIDTNTPIGRAMTMITMVFAQMERESIAVRVSDNMIGLAKKGFWTGGNPPRGYRRERVMVDGKKHVTIKVVPEEAKEVRWLYDTFLANNYSLQSMETAFRKQGITTSNGCFFATTQLYKALTMPYCVEDTPEVYDYYKSLGCVMDSASPREKWDGTHGVMIYGRSTEKTRKHRQQPRNEWIVCIGFHEPFIPASVWLAVQAKMGQNKFEKVKKYDITLLKGTLRCAKCGCLMQVARKKEKSRVYSSYYCMTRMRRGKGACDMSAIGCHNLDEKVLNVFRQIEANPDAIMDYVKEPEPETAEPHDYTAEIAEYQLKIDRLAAVLADIPHSPAAKHIVAEMESLDANIEALRREEEMQNVENRRSMNDRQTLAEKAEDVAKLMRGLDGFTAEEKNEIVRNVVRELTWDGETLFIKL